MPAIINRFNGLMILKKAEKVKIFSEDGAFIFQKYGKGAMGLASYQLFIMPITNCLDLLPELTVLNYWRQDATT
jgi:hypothetical protein